MLIKTQTFNLAVNTLGDKNSSLLFLALPGRLDSKDYCNFTNHLQYFSELGFFSVCFDPPGTWESPGETKLFTTTNYLRAVQEVITYFGNRPTILFGHSRGGATAILAGVDNPTVLAVITVMATLGTPSKADPQDVRRGYRLEQRDMPPGDKKTKLHKKFVLSVVIQSRETI